MIAHAQYDHSSDTYTPISSVHNIAEIPAVTPSNRPTHKKPATAKIFPNSEVNISLAGPHHLTTVKIFPNSGANISLAGPHYLNQLKLTENDLILCHKEVKEVGETVLLCHKWLPIKIIIGKQTTTQLVYFCDSYTLLFQQKTLSQHPHITTTVPFTNGHPTMNPNSWIFKSHSTSSPSTMSSICTHSSTSALPGIPQ